MRRNGYKDYKIIPGKKHGRFNSRLKLVNILLIIMVMFVITLYIIQGSGFVSAEDCDPFTDPGCGDEPDPCPGGVCPPPHPPIVDHAPTITSITGPSCAEPSSSVQITVTASDDHRVNRIYLYRNNVLVDSFNCPYNFGSCTHTFEVQTSNSLCNNDVFKARAVDNKGHYSAYKQLNVFINDYPSVSITAPSSVFVDEYFNITAEASDSCGIASLEIHGWPVKNCHGSTSCELTVQQIEHSTGTYHYGAVVTDSYCGWTDSASTTVYVEEKQQPPVAILHVNVVNGTAPLNVLFDSSYSYDPDGVIVQYCIDYDDGTSYCQNDPIIEGHEFTQPGVYTVSLTVTDDDGLSDTDTVIIIVEEQPNHCPSFTQSTYHFYGYEGQELIIDFSNYANDPDNDPLYFHINHLPSGAVFNPTTGLFSWTPDYTQSGLYSFNITVNDGECGDSAIVTIEIYDINRVPWVDNVFITPNPARTTQDLYCNYDFHDLDNDPDHSVIRWYKNGVLTSYPTLVFPSFETQKGDVFVCEVTPYDGKEYGVAVNSSALVIENTCPEFEEDEMRVTYVEGEEGITNLSWFVNDPDDDSLFYTSSELPRGAHLNPATGVIIWTPDYDQAGNYTVFVSVSDGECSDTLTLHIKVINVNLPPEAVMNFTPTRGCAPLTVHFDGSQSYHHDPDGVIVRYEWGFDDGDSGSGVTIDHTYTTPGTYYPWLRVYDTKGISDLESAQEPIIVLDCNQRPNVTIEALQPNNRCAEPNSTISIFVQGYDDEEVSALYILHENGVVIDSFNCTSNNGYCEHVFNVQTSDIEPCSFETFLAIAEDNKGKVSEEEGVDIMLTYPPSVTLSTNSSVVNENERFLLSADAYGICGLESLRILNNESQELVGEHCDQSQSCSVSVDHSESQQGNYTYTAEVVDYYCNYHYYDSVVVNVKEQGVHNESNLSTSIDCFDKVVVGHNQSCSVFVRDENGSLVGEADVDIYFLNGTLFGSCITDSISGGCEVSKVMNQVGNYTVYATAHKTGFIDDNDTYPRETFEVIPERYQITDLIVYNDSCFTQPDDTFYRGENMYVKFRVFDSLINDYVEGVVTKVTLVSPPGGRAELSLIAESSGWYYYSLTPIPPTHEFLGHSQVFAFAFNFSDGTGIEAQAPVTILNNPPRIQPPINDVETNVLTPVIIDLSQHEFDVEDSGINLTWVVVNHSTGLFTYSLNNKELVITPLTNGSGFITLRLYDLDGDYDEQTVSVLIGYENMPPSVDNVRIEPQDPGDNDDLVCYYDYYDPDNDPDHSIIKWYKNGALFLTGTNTLSKAHTQIGDVFVCEVIPYDNNNYGIPVNSSTVQVGNKCPEFVGLENKTITEGEFLQFIVNAIDPDGDPLVYSAENLPEGANFVNNIFSWTPDYTQSGEYDVLFMVSDGYCTSSGTVHITVVDSENHNPYFTTEPITEARVNEEYHYDADAIDPDGDTLTYSLVNKPDGMSINPSNGLITWTPSEDDIGVVSVKVKVDDGRGGFAEQEYEINVKPPAPVKYPRRKFKVTTLHVLKNDCLEPGDDVVAVINFKNLGFYDTRNVKIRAVVHELDTARTVGPLRVNADDDISKVLIMRIPEDAEEGLYNIRFTLYNDNLRRVVYRDFIVRDSCE